MSTRIDMLVEQVRALTPEEQEVLLGTLQDLLMPSDPGWEEAWVKECEERLAAFERGEMEAVDFDVAMAELRRKYGRP